MKRLAWIVGIGILLSGCSASGSENKISDEYVEQEINKVIEKHNNLSDYPVGVQNGTVSREYYEAIVTYFNRSEEFNKSVQEIENNKDSYTTEERLKKHTKLVNEQIVFLNSIKRFPSNEVEREIDKYFSDVLYYDEEMSNYKAKYYSTLDETYYDLAEDYAVSFEQSGKVLNEMLLKYELMKK